ncbi:MAG: hypothetical protein EZS28_038085 [Streblomastix strix]|uniref:Uncharacterized protein n=1 Tax=Streblomastix strix TaxID=222440 RepID=A0A5J4U7U5_9EUKA|nr:MAG: hypothetical protein EZS28_038085 [Streblomastix strix]
MGQLLSLMSIFMGLNIDSGMSSHPAPRLMQFSLSSISSQTSVHWLQMERFIRMENSQIREIQFQMYSSSAPPMGDRTERVSVNFLLNQNYLQDGTFLEYFSKKRAQTELSCYQATNVDLAFICTQGLPTGTSVDI